MADASTIPIGGMSGGGLFQQVLNSYLQKRQQDAAVTGQIESYLQNPNATGQLSPNGQKLVQKLAQGSANLKDKISLLGEMSSSQAIKQQQATLAAQQAGTQGQYLQNAMQGLNVQQRAAFLNYLFGSNGMMGPQPQQPQGAPQPPQAPPMGAAGGPQTPPPSVLGRFLGQGTQQPGQPPGGLINRFLGGLGANQRPQSGFQPQVAPKTTGQMAPPPPISVQDYIAQNPNAYRTALQMSMGDADRATQLIQNQVNAVNQNRQAVYTAKASSDSPTGSFYFVGPTWDQKTGLPALSWAPQMVTGAGTISAKYRPGDNRVTTPVGVAPPGPALKMDGTALADVPTSEPINQNAPGRQDAIKDAYTNAFSSAAALGRAQLYQQAVQLFNASNGGDTTAGGRLNALVGTPQGAFLRQIISGNNPMSAVDVAKATNTSAILNQIRGPNGSVGGRILEPEYNNTSQMLGEPTMPPAQLQAAANNLYSLALRQNNIDQGYAQDLHRGMTEADAQADVYQRYGPSPQLTAAASPGPISAGAPTPATQAVQPQIASNLPPGWSIRP